MSQRDSNEERVLTRKELARELRRVAYQRAKERHAKDPRTLAMKEAMKLRRRELHQQDKARRKAAASAQKSAAKRCHRAKLVEARATKDGELMKLIAFTAKGSNAQN